jgi:hypothetical protein
LAAAEKYLRFFLSRFFLLPFSRNAQKHDLQKIEQNAKQPREKKKRRKKSTFYVMKKCLCVFELPLLRNAQKRDKRNKGNNKIIKLLFFWAAENVRHFCPLLFIFHVPRLPLVADGPWPMGHG